MPYEQSKRLYEELQSAGKPVEYIEQERGDHGLSRYEDRLQFLQAIDIFLQRYNPPD